MRPPARKLHRAVWPDALRTRSALAAVYVGGCGLSGGRLGRQRAHTHTGLRAPVICYRDDEVLKDEQTTLHELAHAISGEGHTARFRRVLKEIGGGLRPDWHSERPRRGGSSRPKALRHSWAYELVGGDGRGFADLCPLCGWKRYSDNAGIFYDPPTKDDRMRAYAPECAGKEVR